MTRESVQQAAVRLRAAGAGAGSRIALRVEPDPAGVAAVLGASSIGAHISPLNPAWTDTETARVLSGFRPDWVVAPDGSVRPQGRGGDVGAGGADGAAARGMVRPGGGATTRGVDSPGGDAQAAGDPVDPTWVLWSSGTTTGRPRGVVLSQRAFRASGKAVAERLALGPDDRWLCTLSPSHVGGLAILLRSSLPGAAVSSGDRRKSDGPGIAGPGAGFGELRAPGRFEVDRIVRALEEDGITHASFVPTQLLRILDARGDEPAPPALRVLLVGGSAIPPALLRRGLDLGYPIALTWGMTEAASQVATAEPERVREKPGPVGRPLSGIEVKVVSGGAVGTESGASGGELAVRSPTLADGLFVDPDTPPRRITDAQGWYRTGDLGRLDPEGDVRIVGRASDRIITGGVNVSPVEVEQTLLGHPAIREIAVIGVGDPEWGERVVAVAVLEAEAAPPGLEELRAFVERSLSPAKHPREVRFLSELPRNPNGKVDRAALRRLVE